ncbi:MAG TPA: 50S ribosomal protein L6, partial [Gemmatimonadaceae bacterium]|nr:50S ribosomal protein L6 [Gemmatimonadaceae bacterium]
MSRIGKKPVPILKGVTVTLDGSNITVKGPKGELSRSLPAAMLISMKDNEVVVERPSEENEHKALHGLTRTLIANMIEGVTTGFSKQLEIIGVGYKAEQRPYGLQLSLGFSHVIEYRAPAGIKLTAPQPTQVNIEGANKEMVGQVA